MGRLSRTFCDQRPRVFRLIITEHAANARLTARTRQQLAAAIARTLILSTQTQLEARTAPPPHPGSRPLSFAANPAEICCASVTHVTWRTLFSELLHAGQLVRTGRIKWPSCSQPAPSPWSWLASQDGQSQTQRKPVLLPRRRFRSTRSQ